MKGQVKDKKMETKKNPISGQKKFDTTEEYRLLLKQIGTNLAKARRNKGLSQRALGKLMEKNPSKVARIETFAPLDVSLRNIYDVARLIPVSLGEVVSQAEKELKLDAMPREPQKINDRLETLVDRLFDLTQEEQIWMADMIEGLLSRTSSPSKLTDNTDKRPGLLS